MPGLPQITQYHMLKSRRYILTHDTEKKSQLWSLDTLKPAHDWTGVKFDIVKEQVAKYDNYLNRAGLITPNVDLGVLKVSIDMNKWDKSIIDDRDSNVLTKMGLEEPKEGLKRGQEICLGSQLIKNAFRGLPASVVRAQESDIKKALGANCTDYEKILAEEKKKIPEDKGSNFFFAFEDASNQ